MQGIETGETAFGLPLLDRHCKYRKDFADRSDPGQDPWSEITIPESPRNSSRRNNRQRAEATSQLIVMPAGISHPAGWKIGSCWCHHASDSHDHRRRFMTTSGPQSSRGYLVNFGSPASQGRWLPPANLRHAWKCWLSSGSGVTPRWLLRFT
jgi:hypothetical protein